MTINTSIVNGIQQPTPYKACEMYANNEISKSELVDYLVSYDYKQPAKTDFYDDLRVTAEGSWGEVINARYEKLLSEEIYWECSNGRKQLQTK